MKTRLMPVAFAGLLFAGQGLGQSGAIIPKGGAGHAGKASCVILKRMGPADQVTSRLYSFGIRGKQFQYVEGKLPESVPFPWQADRPRRAELAGTRCRGDHPKPELHLRRTAAG